MGVLKLGRKIRLLLGKPGLDGHDRGARIVARILRDAGMEVVYTGLHSTPEALAAIAVQEDVDVIGLSILSGAHDTLVPKVISLLKERGLEDVLCVVGGIIPDEDVPTLIECGVGAVFGPGSPLDEIVSFIRDNVHRRA